MFSINDFNEIVVSINIINEKIANLRGKILSLSGEFIR